MDIDYSEQGKGEVYMFVASGYQHFGKASDMFHFIIHLVPLTFVICFNLYFGAYQPQSFPRPHRGQSR